jgi:hypothetical protein
MSICGVPRVFKSLGPLAILQIVLFAIVTSELMLSSLALRTAVLAQDLRPRAVTSTSSAKCHLRAALYRASGFVQWSGAENSAPIVAEKLVHQAASGRTDRIHLGPLCRARSPAMDVDYLPAISGLPAQRRRPDTGYVDEGA